MWRLGGAVDGVPVVSCDRPVKCAQRKWSVCWRTSRPRLRTSRPRLPTRASLKACQSRKMSFRQLATRRVESKCNWLPMGQLQALARPADYFQSRRSQARQWWRRPFQRRGARRVRRIIAAERLVKMLNGLNRCRGAVSQGSRKLSLRHPNHCHHGFHHQVESGETRWPCDHAHPHFRGR